jgi:hypothetical protein
MIVQRLGIEAVRRRRGRDGLGMCDETPAFVSCFWDCGFFGFEMTLNLLNAASRD